MERIDRRTARRAESHVDGRPPPPPIQKSVLGGSPKPAMSVLPVSAALTSMSNW